MALDHPLRGWPPSASTTAPAAAAIPRGILREPGTRALFGAVAVGVAFRYINGSPGGTTGRLLPQVARLGG